MTPVEWALLALLGAALALDQWPAVHSMASRPVVAGMLAGWILGAPAEGALWGAVFEIAFLGVLPVGAARVSDAALGALAGTVVAVVGRTEDLYPAALAVAVAFAAAQLGGMVDRFQRRANGRLAEWAGERVSEGELGAPGRAVARALARGAALGAVQTVAAAGAGIFLLRFVGTTPWAGRLPAPVVVAAGLAMAAAAGLRLFAAPTRAARAGFLAGCAAGAGIVVWLAA